jgi:hypothetical protein
LVDRRLSVDQGIDLITKARNLKSTKCLEQIFAVPSFPDFVMKEERRTSNVHIQFQYAQLLAVCSLVQELRANSKPVDSIFSGLTPFSLLLTPYSLIPTSGIPHTKCRLIRAEPRPQKNDCHQSQCRGLETDTEPLSYGGPVQAANGYTGKEPEQMGQNIRVDG